MCRWKSARRYLREELPEELDGSITILYAGHTDPTWDRSVDWAITELHPGGVAYYWSIPE